MTQKTASQERAAPGQGALACKAGLCSDSGLQLSFLPFFCLHFSPFFLQGFSSAEVAEAGGSAAAADDRGGR